MDSTVGLKIASNDSFAKCVSIIRNIEPMSIGEIKSKISNNDYVLIYDYFDNTGLKKIIKCYDQLAKIGVEAYIYEDDEPCDIALLKTISKTHQEIEEEFDALTETEEDE